jgi:hypothetical protein
MLRVNDPKWRRSQLQQQTSPEAAHEDKENEEYVQFLISRFCYGFRWLQIKLTNGSGAMNSFFSYIFTLLIKIASWRISASIGSVLVGLLRIIVWPFCHLFGKGRLEKAQGKKAERMDRLKRESEAILDSVIVIYGVQGLVKLLFVLKKEDDFGVGQKYFEQILDKLLTMQRVLNDSRDYGWALGNFGNAWFVKTPGELMWKTREVVDWGLNQIFACLGMEADLKSLTAANCAAAKRILSSM